MAEDAAQATFLVLARKASSLRPGRDGATLAGWLFQAARLTAKNAARQERRRRAAERSYSEEATRMHSQTPDTAAEWADAEPLLNEALSALPAGQRALVLERYFQDRPLAEIGAGRGISEDAARMRVNRALDRLRRFFAARGVALSAAALAALLGQSVRPAPARCAEALSRLPLSPDTPAHALAHGVIHTMNQKRLQLKLGAAALVIALPLGTLGAVQVSTQMRARTVRAEKAQDQARALTVLDQMYATYAAMNSFKCTVSSRGDQDGTAQDATYLIERPNKIRFHRATLLGTDLTGQALAVSDGKALYVTCTEDHGQADRYAKMPLNSAAGDPKYLFQTFGGLPGWGSEPSAGMPDVALGIKLQPPGSLEAPEYSLGKPALITYPDFKLPFAVDVVIARMLYKPGTPNRDWPGAAESVAYYIGQKDHLLYQTVVTDAYSPTTPDIRTETYFMKINPSVPESDFVFTPPPGSHEVSTTDDLFPKK